MQIETQEQKEKLELLIKKLIESETWKVIKSNLEEKIKIKEEQILADFNINRNKPEYSINDLEKIELLVYKNILKEPENMLEDLQSIFPLNK